MKSREEMKICIIEIVSNSNIPLSGGEITDLLNNDYNFNTTRQQVICLLSNLIKQEKIKVAVDSYVLDLIMNCDLTNEEVFNLFFKLNYRNNLYILKQL
jgi:hypothetical protein